MTIITSQDLNQNLSKAKHLADQEPVFITDDGERAYVLMSYTMYQQFREQHKSNAQRVSMSEEAAVQMDDDFEFERISIHEREVSYSTHPF